MDQNFDKFGLFQGLQLSISRKMLLWGAPREMTTVQRDAIPEPILGTQIYNLDTNKLNLYTGAWEEIQSA